jgi:uncharacterized protein (TIGR03086 family)
LTALQSYGFIKFMDHATMTQACAATERVVAGVTPADYGRPTPCTEWDVRALLNHVLGTLALGRDLLGDSPPADPSMGPGGLPAADLVGDDPLDAYRKGVAGLLAAAGDGLGRMHATPLGEMPGHLLGGFTTLDILVHGWDLARATGQDATVDPTLAAEVLAFAHSAVTDASRAPLIGPEVPVAAHASVTDRLIGYMGRRP